MSSHSADLDGMGSIPASPDALNVPLLLCQERFNAASLLDGWSRADLFDGLVRDVCGPCRWLVGDASGPSSR